MHLSVPTRFLKSWIQAHYAERVLSAWQAEMPEVHRIDLTVRTAVRLIERADRWAALMPEPRRLAADLIDEGRAIPPARVQALHEGRRRARARRD